MEANECPLTKELFLIHPFALQIKLNQAKGSTNAPADSQHAR